MLLLMQMHTAWCHIRVTSHRCYGISIITKSIVCSTACSGLQQGKSKLHIPHKGQLMQKAFPIHGVIIMYLFIYHPTSFYYGIKTTWEISMIYQITLSLSMSVTPNMISTWRYSTPINFFCFSLHKMKLNLLKDHGTTQHFPCAWEMSLPESL